MYTLDFFAGFVLRVWGRTLECHTMRIWLFLIFLQNSERCLHLYNRYGSNATLCTTRYSSTIQPTRLSDVLYLWVVSNQAWYTTTWDRVHRFIWSTIVTPDVSCVELLQIEQYDVGKVKRLAFPELYLCWKTSGQLAPYISCVSMVIHGLFWIKRRQSHKRKAVEI